MATFHPTPFGALAVSAKDLPASLNAASNACGHRAHVISAISVADISGDNARWAAWRAIALRQPAGPIAPTARIGAAPSAIVVARCRDVCQRVEVCASGIAFGFESERRQPFGGLEPIAWGRWQAVPEATAPIFAHGPMYPLRSYTGRQCQRRLLRYSPTRSAVTTRARTGLRGM
ncbi:MAG: hypothetical protein RL077_2205 [Verrucomicrobiota bacterium]